MKLPPFEFWEAGCNVLPLRTDGSKAPAIGSWTELQTRRASEAEMSDWFQNQKLFGFGAICGVISRGLEVIDFDIPDDQSIFFEWYRNIESIAVYLPVVETPNYGFHVYYRCSTICGNSKIAIGSDGKALIETRGEGGYVVAPGSSRNCHPSGRPYVQDRGPVLPVIPTISERDRRRLWEAARAFDKSHSLEKLKASEANKARRKFRPASIQTQGRAGDDFNRRGDFDGYLRQNGWTSTDGEHWTRPRKSGGVSATLRNCQEGFPVLVNFSSNSPITNNTGGHKTLSLFELFTQTEHAGDYQKAAAELRQRGFGK